MNSLSTLTLPLVVAAFAATSVACSSDSDPAKAEQEQTPDSGKPDPTPDAESPLFPRAYVGEVEGTDARVGIFGKDERSFRLYFCGGPETLGTLTHWFNTTATEPPPDGYDWDGQIERDLAQGAIRTPDGERHAFTARPVTWGELPGLYEATAPCGKVGVIVSPVPNSDELHLQGACAGAVVADSKQVNPILPLTRRADGSVEVQVEGETETVLVKPATM